MEAGSCPVLVNAERPGLRRGLGNAVILYQPAAAEPQGDRLPSIHGRKGRNLFADKFLPQGAASVSHTGMVRAASTVVRLTSAAIKGASPPISRASI